MISAQRRKIIIDKISSGMPLSVNELSRELGVSPMTIRRDLETHIPHPVRNPKIIFIGCRKK
ncbi:DeoR family transcriptional regulator [Neomoorella thermoacetica]|uniref:DeoR family transcriptional regulator n=1 Tax=Neomoorella thermoacetica TaxID=1525 RepID=UPI000921F595|nr:DeoR-like helix-turn-helix domain protein [Moorella thermoacetica]